MRTSRVSGVATGLRSPVFLRDASALPSKKATVSSEDMTVPRNPPLGVTTSPPWNGFTRSAVPFTNRIGTAPSTGTHTESSGTGRLAPKTAMALARLGSSSATRNAMCPPPE
jgi:hypothetical protein